jgi:3-hydroxymyristoyl/3-hydroxydecanoyl-(acyl carrier protein) dehydratase
MLPNSQEQNDPAFKLPDDTVILDRIRVFVADAADCGIDQVGLDDDIYDNLHVDSLGATAIFIDISYEFRVREPDSDTDFQALNTPRKRLSYVRNQSGAQTATLLTPTGLTIPPDISTLDISKLLPYGTAFRLVEKVLAHEAGGIVTTMTWSLENPMINAHFIDGAHVVPGVLLIEQIAQSALLLGQLEGFVSTGEHLALAQLRCDFRASVLAPVTTRAEVSFRAMSRGNFGFVGSCRDGEKEVARIKGIAARRGSEARVKDD